MVEYIKTYLLYGNQFCGVEYATENEEEIIHASVLKKTKKEVDIKAVFSSKTITEFAEKVPKKQHVFLIINNNNVLSKQIESEQTEADKLVNKAFPNINLDDFYYEIHTQNKSHFISICRKLYAEELIETHKQQGFSIINLSLGNTIVSTLSHFLKTDEISTSNAKVSFENQSLNTIEKTEIKDVLDYTINGLQVNSTNILSFSGALQPILNSFNPTTNFERLKTSTLKYDYKHSRFFSLFLKFGLLLILTTLMINFFVFNHYFNQVEALQQTSQVNQTTKQKILKLNESVSKSQKMVNDMLKGGHSKSAYYINEIVQSLPNSILFTEFDYQPVLKRIKKGKPVESLNNTILVSGKSNNSELFSKWLINVESIDWVNHIEIISYEDFSKSTSNFSLKLSMSHD